MCDVICLKNIFNFLYKKNKFIILYRDILFNMVVSFVRFFKDGIQMKLYKSKFILVEWFEIDINVKVQIVVLIFICDYNSLKEMSQDLFQLFI